MREALAELHGDLQGIRNPEAHALNAPLAPNRYFEYLAAASLLMRRLDDAEETACRWDLDLQECASETRIGSS